MKPTWNYFSHNPGWTKLALDDLTASRTDATASYEFHLQSASHEVKISTFHRQIRCYCQTPRLKCYTKAGFLRLENEREFLRFVMVELSHSRIQKQSLVGLALHLEWPKAWVKATEGAPLTRWLIYVNHWPQGRKFTPITWRNRLVPRQSALSNILPNQLTRFWFFKYWSRLPQLRIELVLKYSVTLSNCSSGWRNSPRSRIITHDFHLIDVAKGLW